MSDTSPGSGNPDETAGPARYFGSGAFFAGGRVGGQAGAAAAIVGTADSDSLFRGDDKVEAEAQSAWPGSDRCGGFVMVFLKN